MDRPGWSKLEQNLWYVLWELDEQEDFLKAVVQRRHPSLLLTDQEYRRITRFSTNTDQNRAFLMYLMDQPDRFSFGAFCVVLREVGLTNIADFLETEKAPLALSHSSGLSMGTCTSAATLQATAATPGEIFITAKNVIMGSNSTIVEAPSKLETPRSRRFNFITPMVRELYGRDKELEKALDLLKDQESPVVILQGIVGIGKTSLGKKICKAYLQKAKDIYPDAPLCFMVQFTTDTLSSPEMVYKEILIQMFGDEGLGYDGLDERGYLNLLTGFCRQLPANCILLMDDCENIIPSPKMIPVLTKALQKLMECSDNLKVVIVSSIDISSSLHDLLHQKFVLPALSLEAAVQVLERSEISGLPGREKLQEIAVHSYCHPLLLGMALQLLPVLGADQFLREISHEASSQMAVLEESEATGRLKQFFLRLERANLREFTAFLELAIIPGKFSLDDWELECATRCALQRRLLIDESQTEGGNRYWSVPPVLRQVAMEEREKRPEVDRRAKERFGKYCSKLMRRLSSRLYTEMRSVLRELDVQRSNVQLLLNCVSDWKEDLKMSTVLLSEVLHSLTYPGIGYMLSLRFSVEDRCTTFMSLSDVASDLNTTDGSEETLAKVYLELCHIKRMSWEDARQNLKDADKYAEKALQLFGGDAPDIYQAQYLSVKGSILADMNSWDDTAVTTLETAVKTLQKLRVFEEDISTEDHEKYLAYIELLSSVWKDLGKVYGKRKQYNNALSCLQTAIKLRSEVFGADHITQVVLLMKFGKMQAKQARQASHTENSEMLVNELLHLATDSLRKAIAICNDYGCQRHHLNGITNFVLGRTLTHRKMFDDALKAFHEANSVFTHLGSGCSYRLALVYSARGYCYKCMGDTENEIACHKKCLELLSETKLSHRRLMQSTYRNLVDVYKLRDEEEYYRHYIIQMKYIQSLSNSQYSDANTGIV